MAKKPQADAVQRVIDAAMALAAETGWDHVTLVDLAARSGISLADLRDVTPSRGAVLGMFERMIDRKVLEGTTDELAGEPVKDRVFDVMMRRIDALAPYKDAIRSINASLRRDPPSLVAFNGVALNSMRYMLAAAGADTDDALGTLKLQGAVVTFARVLQVWLSDDSADLARTMAALDRELVRGGRVLSVAGDLHRLTAPLRAFARALCETGERVRERVRAPRGPAPPADDGIVSI